MSNPPATPRRLTIAITAAVASTTLAVGVTAASLMGWFAPTPPTATATAEPVASPHVILVPITPAAQAPAATPLQADVPEANLQLAMDRRDDDDRHERDDRHDRDDRHEDDDE